MLLYNSIGVLKYDIIPSYGFRLVLEIEQDIVDYYYSLIPKYYGVKSQQYKAHISVVRKETPPYLYFWGKYQDRPIRYFWEPTIYHENNYWWLDCFCLELEEIRKELGLWYKGKYTMPPKPWGKYFHCTIGNNK